MPRSILEKEKAKTVAVDYSPKKFPVSISEVAQSFVRFQASSDENQTLFKIDRVVAQTTGIGDLERRSLEEKVEQAALEKLQQIQEQAYEAGHLLGVEEGRELALKNYEQEMREKLDGLQNLFDNLQTLKKDMVTSNEAHIVKLIYYLASRIASTEIAENKDLILHVVMEAIANAQSEERVKVKVSKADFEFLQQAKTRVSKDTEFLGRIELEEADNVAPGGCIVETNFGVVDASIEQRVSKLWDTVRDKIPKVKEKLEAG